MSDIVGNSNRTKMERMKEKEEKGTKEKKKKDKMREMRLIIEANNHLFNIFTSDQDVFTKTSHDAAVWFIGWDVSP